MQEGGWLPREQILGPEARSAVPEQFREQQRLHANPPILLLPLMGLVDRVALQASSSQDGGAPDSEDMRLLRWVYPRLLSLYQWFKSTQVTPPSTPFTGVFQWQGKTVDHLLASGLDDYPRGLLPIKEERHLDLQVWMIFFCESLSSLSSVLGYGEERARLEPQCALFRQNLEEKFINKRLGIYSDFNGRQPSLKSAKQRGLPLWRNDGRCGPEFPSPAGPASLCNPYSSNPCCSPSGWCGASEQHCNCPQCHKAEPLDKFPEMFDWREEYSNHIGYVSLYPIFFGLVPADSPRFKALLDVMSSPSKLWSDFGLRSLAKDSPLYGTGEDYWRGAIWINLNYMTLRGLYRHYIAVEGPHQQQARDVYSRLRQNIISNIYSEYRRTGFLWEQYSGEDGRGRRSHPFTGWTALVVLIMAEMY
eukprot:GILI01032640.1.p1 GENE.GILI01032640.1~~GILI01032640.1.p1  ORF type:complete len:419 (+),score=89.82 GILI01032640.1:147-1403(+)